MKVRRTIWLAATSQIGFFSSLPVNGLRMVTIRLIPTVRSTCLIASLYCCAGMNGRSLSSGKVMKYDPLTGHRIKDPTAKTPITWVHSLLKQRGVLPQEWELTQCLFGEHLLKKYPDKPVCLVESEKTAIICACINPECIWLATGGKGQLNDRVEALDGRTIIAFPDVDGYDAWVTKAAERPYLNIADILIRRQLGMPSYSVPKPQAQPPDELYADNPVMREVMKYISPEHWDTVAALIEEFDLEFLGVTRKIME